VVHELQKRLIPILLIRDNGLMKSRNFNDWTYVGDVVNTAKIFNDKDVDELLLIDTQASMHGRGPNFELIEQIASECYLPIAYGGGVRSNQDAQALVKCGVDKVVINSLFLRDSRFVSDIAHEIGSSSTVVSLDAIENHSGYSVSNPATGELDSRTLENLVLEAESKGAGEILIQSVDRDGTKSGPDLGLAQLISKTTNLPIIYGGGVASLGHAGDIWGMDVDGVAAGSWFVFSGSLNAVLVTYPPRHKIIETIGSL